MPPTQLVGFAIGLEALDGELANRLQHGETLVGLADQALVDEGAQDIEVGVADCFGGVDREAATEDREVT